MSRAWAHRRLVCFRVCCDRVIFWGLLRYWPRYFGNIKSGLLGGHLGVAQVGAHTAGKGGYELVAFTPVPPHEPGGSPAPPAPPAPTPPPTPRPAWHCHQWNASEDKALAGGASQEAVCKRVPSQRWTGGDNAGCPGCGTCYCCSNSTAPAPGPPGGTLPRLPNINYNPGVFVMLRAEVSSSLDRADRCLRRQCPFAASNALPGCRSSTHARTCARPHHIQTAAGGATTNGTRYFYASNDSTFELPQATGAATFYARLLAVHAKVAAQLAPMMTVELPDSDHRQRDMALASILATTNNYVGNQPNYGFGATYWSYGREDNGSLPLDMLAVDTAVLEWGGCDLGLDHLDFYFSNYVMPDGIINYGPIWG